MAPSRHPIGNIPKATRAPRGTGCGHKSQKIYAEIDGRAKFGTVKKIQLNMTTKLIARHIPNLDKLDKAQLDYTSFKARRIGTFPNNSRKGFGTELIIDIATSKPDNHFRAFTLKTSSVRERLDEVDFVTGFYLDKGIFTGWRFRGTRGSDSLEFGQQGHIFSKGTTGIVNFGKDDQKDMFTFANQIDVPKCSEKHSFTCSRYNHLSNVKIINFGREDILNIQGDIYRFADVKNGLPGDLASRLSVEIIPGL